MRRTDSPLCDEVNKFLTELANRKHWRILVRKTRKRREGEKKVFKYGIRIKLHDCERGWKVVNIR